MSNLGLLGYTSASGLQQQEAERARLDDEERTRRVVESSLSAHINRSFEQAKHAKREVEDRLVDCARRHRGEYSPSKLAEIKEIGGSEMYPKLTTTKNRALASWIADILMPSQGLPWGLDPTPVSDIPPEYLQAFLGKLQQEDPEITEDVARKKILAMVKELSDKAAKKHEDLIEDQLAEGGWNEALEDFIEDFSVYPAAFMKGPILHKVVELAWQEGWVPVQVEEIKPTFKRVSPFDIYPAADSSGTQDGSFLIERERFTRRDLSQMIGVKGSNEEEIRGVLRDHGNGGLRSWQAIDQQRAELEDRPNEMMYRSEQIEGLLYWGSAQGLMLLNWGMNPDQITDPLAEYDIEAILIGQYVVRAVINQNPMGARPYGKASFQKVPGSFWGKAVAELMDDIQDMCCSVARAQSNNMAFASGPQVEVNVDRLAPGEDPNEMYPLKRWRTKSDKLSTGAQIPAISFFQPDSRAAELNGVYDAWERRADDATNIPRYTYGNERVGGAGNTMGGLAMLMESANKGIKNAIRHIDRGLVRPMVSAMWLHNMMYSEDNAIKGDCKVVPKGASAMLIREQVQEARNQFLAVSGNEIDMQIMGIKGRAKLLRSVAERLDMPDLIPDDDEIESRQAEQQQAAQAEQEEAKQMHEQMMAIEQGKDQAKLQGEEQKRQIDGMKAQTDALLKQLQGGKVQAETRQILIEIQETLNNMRQGNANDGTASPSPSPAAQQPGLSGNAENLGR